MARLCVVYDANVYVGLSDVRLQALHRAERANGIVALATYAVVTELVAHLKSRSDSDFGRCWNALMRLARHCVRYDGKRLLIQFIADAEDQLCATLFHCTIPARKDQPEEYGELVQVIATASTPEEFESHRDFIDALADEVNRQEKDWADLVWRDLICRFAPDATNWHAIQSHPALRSQLVAYLATPTALRAHAEAMVSRAAASVGVQVAPEEREALIDAAIEAFAVPLSLFLTVLRRIIENGHDLSKPEHSNTLWDLQIAHCTSPVGRVDGSPIWLITTDAMMLDCVAGTANNLLIRRLADYESLVLSGESVLDEIGKTRTLGWASR